MRGPIWSDDIFPPHRDPYFFILSAKPQVASLIASPSHRFEISAKLASEVCLGRNDTTALWGLCNRVVSARCHYVHNEKSRTRTGSALCLQLTKKPDVTSVLHHGAATQLAFRLAFSFGIASEILRYRLGTPLDLTPKT